MHGGAPSALFAHVCEQHDPGSGRRSSRASRWSCCDRCRSCRSTMRVRTIRPGRKVQWLEAALLDADEREVARATVLRLRSDEVDTSGSVELDVDRAAAARQRPAAARVRRPDRRRATGSAHDVRIVRGQLDRGRSRHRVVPAAVPGGRGGADLGVRACGRGRRLRQRRREPAALHARVRRSTPTSRSRCTATRSASGSASSRARGCNPHGVGLAETRLHDEQGAIGRARADAARRTRSPNGRTRASRTRPTLERVSRV